MRHRQIPAMVGMLVAVGFVLADPAQPSAQDQPFWQEIAEPYPSGIDWSAVQPISVRVDRDGRVLILTKTGLLSATAGRVAPYREMASLMSVQHADLEMLGGKFVHLTDRFLLPIHGAGADYLSNLELTAERVAAIGPGKYVLLTRDEVIEVDQGNLTRHPNPGYTELVADESSGKVVLYAPQMLARYPLGGSIQPIKNAPHEIRSVAINQDEIVVATATGLFSIDQDQAKPWPHPIPVETCTVVRRDPLRGWLWVGTTDGCFRQDDDGRNSYYWGPRWLPNNHVVDIAFDSAGDVFVLTKAGLVKLDFDQWTLEKKADKFLAYLRKYHVRFGLVADANMPHGDYAGLQVHDSDNDGLWTSMYLAGEAFRYAVTSAPDARENLADGLDAIDRLLSLPTVPGFQARSFEVDGFRVSDPHAWRKRPEKDFEWKGTTSSDEIVGTMFLWNVVAETLGEKEPAWKDRAAHFVGAVMGHIVDHDLYLVDVDGQPTRWGFWNPANLNTPIALHDRRLNSIEILAFLQLAYDLTGEAKFKNTYDILVDRHGYAENTVRYLPDPLGPWNHSDDELYWLSNYVLLGPSIRESLSEPFLTSVRQQFEANRRKRNPLWNAIHAARTSDPIDQQGMLFWLREFPFDHRHWEVKNSHRKDIEIDRRPFVPPEAVPVLPPDERSIHKWNTNEMTLDGGGDGGAAESGAEYLLPYWMARYYGLIGPAQEE